MMLATGVVITTHLGAKQLSQQLTIKNNESANLLAEILSTVEKEKTLFELIISAQFNTNYYEHIRLRNTDGKIVIEKTLTEKATAKTPKFFLNFINADAASSIALIGRGLSQYEPNEVKSNPAALLDELWHITTNYAVAFASIALLIVVVISFYPIFR